MCATGQHSLEVLDWSVRIFSRTLSQPVCHRWLCGFRSLGFGFLCDLFLHLRESEIVRERVRVGQDVERERLSMEAKAVLDNLRSGAYTTRRVPSAIPAINMTSASVASGSHLTTAMLPVVSFEMVNALAQALLTAASQLNAYVNAHQGSQQQ